MTRSTILRSIISASPQSQTPDYYRRIFKSFLLEQQLEQVINIINLDAEQFKHLPFNIYVPDLVHFNPVLAFNCLNYPKLLLPILEDALYIAQTEIFSTSEYRNRFDRGTVKRNMHVRFKNLPTTGGYVKRQISDLRAPELGQLVQLTGTIVKTGPVKLLEVSRQYECKRARCASRFRVYADPELDNQLPQPRVCPSLQSSRHGRNSINSSNASQSDKKCLSMEFTEVTGSKIVVDYQEIKIQDSIENLDIGSAPRTLTVTLSCDLVDKFHPGSKVCIIGYMLRQWKYLPKGERCIVGTLLNANNIQSINPTSNLVPGLSSWKDQFASFWSHWKSNGQIFTGRDIIVEAFCPQLFGMYYVKLATLLTLIGGTVKADTHAQSQSQQYNQELLQGENGQNADNQRNDLLDEAKLAELTSIPESSQNVRTHSHLLLVGDPGCGKSQILRFIGQLCPRAVLTTGIGTSGAGLTCAATKDGNDWTLEAGALVLANGGEIQVIYRLLFFCSNSVVRGYHMQPRMSQGVCCIDEFGSIKAADRATIHEAMEQQTISIAKAGIVTRLEAKTTVIATCNPKGSFDADKDISTNTSIATSLLSRFDIVLVLLDLAQKDWDRKISTHLLMPRIKGAPAIDTYKKVPSPEIWNLNKLREYLLYVKSTFRPPLSYEASQLLVKYYNMQRRQSSAASSGRATVRLLESLVRLSQAHAKLMFQDEVLIHDAIVAIHCMNLSQSQSASLLESNASVLQSEFPSDSEKAYREIEAKVLKIVGTCRSTLSEGLKQSMHISEISNNNFSKDYGKPHACGKRKHGEFTDLRHCDSNDSNPVDAWAISRTVTLSELDEANDWTTRLTAAGPSNSLVNSLVDLSTTSVDKANKDKRGDRGAKQSIIPSYIPNLELNGLNSVDVLVASGVSLANNSDIFECTLSNLDSRTDKRLLPTTCSQPEFYGGHEAAKQSKRLDTDTTQLRTSGISSSTNSSALKIVGFATRPSISSKSAGKVNEHLSTVLANTVQENTINNLGRHSFKIPDQPGSSTITSITTMATENGSLSNGKAVELSTSITSFDARDADTRQNIHGSDVNKNNSQGKQFNLNGDNYGDLIDASSEGAWNYDPPSPQQNYDMYTNNHQCIASKFERGILADPNVSTSDTIESQLNLLPGYPTSQRFELRPLQSASVGTFRFEIETTDEDW